MRSPWFTLVVVMLITSGMSLCDESSPPQPVATDAVDAPETDSETAPTGEQVRAAISADLIDLSKLRAEIERPPGQRTLRMTLQEAISLTLANNPDILIASIEPEKADAEKLAARGEFDPVLQQNLHYSDASISLDQQLRRFARISAIESTNITSETTLGGKLRTGAHYALQFNMNFEETTFGGFQGEYGGQIGLTLTQPLLRGFGRDINTIRIRAAGNLRDISDAQVELTILNKVADTVKAYWDLAGATEAVRVYEGALHNAERLLNINKKRRDIGTAADIDVLQAKAGVAMRQSELIAAYARIADAGDALKLVLNIRDEGLFSKVVVIPTDRPGPDAAPAFASDDFDEIVKNGEMDALKFRPEMRMTDLEIANAELEAQRAKNEMLPQFDIVGSYARGGRNQQFGRTLSGVLEEQDRTYGLGVQGSIIIGNRAARGAHQRARLNVRQAEERRKKTEMALMMGVHLAGRAVITSKTLMESNRQTVRLQEANVSAEEKRLQLGVTTSYQVLRVQEDLTAARVQELQARIAYEKAVVDFQLATGTLLDELGLTFNG